MRRTRDGSSASRILIRLPNWVGDILLALPALQALRAARPHAQLVAMARPQHVELASRISAVDRIVPAPPGAGSLPAWWRAVRALRAARLQAAVLLAPSFEAALTALAGGIPVRVGHGTDHRSLLLTHPLDPTRRRHRADGFLELVGALGAGPASGALPFRLQAAERQHADRLFAQAGLTARDRPVLVNPAAAKTPRAWSADRFRRLADTIADRHPGLPVLVHARPPFAQPAGWPRNAAIRSVRDVTLMQLGAVIERCRLYVGNDSGPMHLAAALGVPTVGIYGPSSPARTSPRGAAGAAHQAVSARLPCSPCRERFFDECPAPPTTDGRPPCLDAVPVEDVAAEVERMLAIGVSRPAWRAAPPPRPAAASAPPPSAAGGRRGPPGP